MLSIRELAIIGLGAVFFVAFVHGWQKQADIDSRTYYDKELGRTVYVERGV